MLVAPIKSLAFDLRHQVFVNTLHFTDFDVLDKKMDAIIETTVRKLGHREAKELQTKSIKEFVSGKDVFVSVPTGYGKTVCYACLPMVFDTIHGHELPYSVIIVVSPLKALMREQVLILRAKGLSVIQVSGDSEDMEQDLKANISKGMYQVIYTSPEILLANKEWSDVFQSSALRQRLVGVVIDEAHCIKKWYTYVNVWHHQNIILYMYVLCTINK